LRPRGIVVAIDGPSGAGKSTAAKELARRLGYTFVDTGAMYRALAWRALTTGVPLEAAERLAALLHATRIELTGGGRGVVIDGRPVSAEIRTQEVSDAASRVSVHPAVRREMVARQRELGRDGGVVLDGRDIGSAVFPDAEVKFYLDADPTSRAARRHGELSAAGQRADLATIERDIRERDHKDSTRSDSPLVRTPDAVYVDTTQLTPEEVVERMLSVVGEQLGEPIR
jgi:cytidylate kinase